MKRPIALLLLAASLPGCSESGDHGSDSPFKLVYHATLPKGSLTRGYFDRIHASPQPLEEGESGVTGATATWSPGAHGLKLAVKAPPSIATDDTPSAGLFSTGLNFGPGAVFSIRAQFLGPDGPHLPPTAQDTNAWAVGVAARTGDKVDRGSDTRLTVTFKVRNDTAILNVQEGGKKVGSLDVPAQVYESIFRKPSPRPFVLELLIDRNAGKGVASLKVAGPPQQLKFDLTTFQATSGPPITTVGATLADCCAPGALVSVEVLDFQISTRP